MPTTLSSRYTLNRYDATRRLDRTLTDLNYPSRLSRRARLYASRNHLPAYTAIGRDNANHILGENVATLIRQVESGESDIEDLVEELNELVTNDSTISNRFSSRLVSLLEEAETCTDCHCYLAGSDEIYTLDDNSGDTLCQSCRDNDCYYCDSCGNLHRSGDTRYVNDHCYCDSCYEEQFTQCDNCRDSVSRDEVELVNGDNTWCESCVENYAHYCSSTEEYRTRPCEDCDCEDCHEEDCDCRVCTLILDYCTTLCRNLSELPSNRVSCHILGCELEMEVSNRRDYARSLRDLFPATKCHCKRDGSLDSDSGVEVVTGYGRQSELLAVVESAANLARCDYAGQSHNGDSCGLHISLDRSQFSSALQARIIVFWNSGENYQFLRQFTRRDYRNLSYCSIKPEKACDAFIARPDLSSREKYEIVNTRHASHLEFRGFRGSLLPTTLRACVSLVSLIATYCEEASTASELTSGRFIDWLLHRVAVDDERRLAVTEYLTRRGKALAAYAANHTLPPSTYPLFEEQQSA